MILDILIEDKKNIKNQFIKAFSKLNYIYVDTKSDMEIQVSNIENLLGQPFFDRFLVYSNKFDILGTVLSRRYINSAKINKGPLIIGNMNLMPDHISIFPNNKDKNRILFLAPHPDEAYLAAILLHKIMEDEIFLFTFTYPKEYKNKIKKAYQSLGLNKDEYDLGIYKDNMLFQKKESIKETLHELLNKVKPSVVFSVFPKGSNFDHITVAKIVEKIVLNESSADLIYGYVIQSRNTNPTIYPIYSEKIYKKILKTFGNDGFGNMFKKYIPYLKLYTKMLSEPLLRFIGEKKLLNIYTLPLEAVRIRNYKIPLLLNDSISGKKYHGVGSRAFTRCAN